MTAQAFKLTRRERRINLVLTFLAFILVYILWNLPVFDFLMYPLRLFTTYVHEAGHSLGALISGGQVLGFQVFPNGSGVATTAGGSAWLILPAGYLGAALFGSGLFYLTNAYPRWSDGLAIAIGIAVALFTVLFARAGTAIIVGLGFGLALMILGWKAGERLTLLVLNILAIITGLNAVFDIWYIVQNSDAGLGNISNDAAAFSRQLMPLIPAWLVALVWAGIALVLMGLAIWYGVVKPLRMEVDEAYNALSAS